MTPEDIPISEPYFGEPTQVPILPPGKYKIEALRLLAMPAAIVLKHATHILSVQPLHNTSGVFYGITIVSARRIEDGE